MTTFLRDAAAGILYATGAASFFLKRAGRGKALILAYHHVVPGRLIRDNRLMTGMYLSTESFEEHLGFLTRHFRIEPLEKIVALIRSGASWEEPLCAVTFDDGWKDVYDYALPLLKEYGVPATVFSVRGMVGLQGPGGLDGVFEAIQMTDRLVDIRSGVAEIDALIGSDAIPDRVEKARQVINRIRELPYDEFMKTCAGINRYLSGTFDLDGIRWKYETMSWDDMREAQEQGVDFGYHSRTHPMLTNVPAALLEEELALPLKEYGREGILLKPVFCYPDGKFSEEAVAVLRDERYMGAVTLQKGFNDAGTNPFFLRRVNIHEGNGGSLFRFVLSIGIQNR